MLVLFETSAGYSLFKLLDPGKLERPDDLWKEFETQDKARRTVQLSAFSKFQDTTDALAAITSIVESKVSKQLKSFLKENIVDKGLKDKLLIADSKLASAIKEKLGIATHADGSVTELMRCLRFQVPNLISGLTEKDLTTMSLGLSHSLSRYKLKFSPDKVDTMVVQAIGLLDELDKELNTYAMRAKEWYGWHFPELAKIVTDNRQFARLVKLMTMRKNALTLDLTDVLPEDIAKEVRDASIVSMGTDISVEDMDNIVLLCDQVISLSTYRDELYEYLKNRMNAIAPNLTMMVGELVGARLISHAGSLMNLAKYPASTVQILGAEKALFRALKTKHETPKYGLIYHASLIGQASTKNKGKISRVLAAKAALSIRVDALGDSETATVGQQHFVAVENRLRQLEGRQVRGISGQAKSDSKIEKYQKPAGKVGSTYNTAADSTIQAAPVESKEKTEKKDKKDKKVEEAAPEKSEKKDKKDKKEKEDKKEEKKDKKEEKKDKKDKKEEKEDKKDKKDKKEKRDRSEGDDAEGEKKKKKKKE